MAQLRPFRGLRYNPEVIRDLSRTVCPPYDIISPSEAAALRHRSVHNAVNLELPSVRPDDTPGSDRYSRAADLLRRWLGEGVLVREQSPAMYLLEEDFTFNGASKRRRGLISAVRLEEFYRGIVLPHEYTTPGPKADRLALMKATRANFSPLMALYRDSDATIGSLLDRGRQGKPTVIAGAEGLPHYTLWALTDPALLSKICDGMAPRQVFVADGHHRYETALRYRDELEASGGPLSPDAAARFVMMALVPMDDPGFLVLPYHRLFAGLRPDDLASLRARLEQAFRLDEVGVPTTSPGAIARTIEDRLVNYSSGDFAVAVVGLESGRVHMLTLREGDRPKAEGPALEKCDTWILHQRAVIPALGPGVETGNLSFVHDAVEAVGRVYSGEQQLAFLLRPIPMDLFEEVVGKEERLPPKSTYFHPKLPTGLVFNSLQGSL